MWSKTWTSTLLLCSLQYLVLTCEALVPPISGEIDGAITDGSAVFLLANKTIRRYDPLSEPPSWTRNVPGLLKNIGFDEAGNIVVTDLNRTSFVTEGVSVDVEIVDTLTGNTIVGAPVPRVDVRYNPKDLNEFLVIGGNVTGIFPRLHPLFSAAQHVSLPGQNLHSFRLQGFRDIIYSGSGTNFTIAFWDADRLTVGVEDPSDNFWFFQGTLEPVEGPLSMSTRVELAADAEADALYMAGFPSRNSSDTLHVYRLNLTDFQTEWMQEVAGLRQTGGGIGITVRKGFDQVVVASVLDEEGEGMLGDVIITALDAASGSVAWEAGLETAGKDNIHSAHSLDDGVIAVVGELNQEGDGNAVPVCFFNETGPLRPDL